MPKNTRNKLFTPISPAAVGLFRIVFGCLLMLHVYGQWPDIHENYLKPAFHFSYPGLFFFQPWPGHGMLIHLSLMFTAALAITLGVYYRQSMITFFFLNTYLFLIDTAYYKDYFYLLLLISFLMTFIPADTRFALKPANKDAIVLYWQVWILRFQFCIVYLFSGFNKINWDWLCGEPIRHLLQNNNPFKTETFLSHFYHSEWFVQILIYGGILAGFLIPILLILKRTRVLGVIFAVAFNLTNMLIFPNSKSFSLMMLISLILFFKPDWPDKLHNKNIPDKRLEETGEISFQPATKTVFFIIIFCALQICLPLRHYRYPGDVMWTAQGERFAWRMMLKREYGRLTLKMFNEDFKNFPVFKDYQGYINFQQFITMQNQPEMILKFAHYLHKLALKRGIKNPVITADCWHAINGRPFQRMTKENINLSTIKSTTPYDEWIYPYNDTLPRRPK